MLSEVACQRERDQHRNNTDHMLDRKKHNGRITNVQHNRNKQTRKNNNMRTGIKWDISHLRALGERTWRRQYLWWRKEFTLEGKVVRSGKE